MPLMKTNRSHADLIFEKYYCKGNQYFHSSLANTRLGNTYEDNKVVMVFLGNTHKDNKVLMVVLGNTYE